MLDTNRGALHRRASLVMSFQKTEEPMRSEELDRFETILSARVAELENKARRRDRIVVERSPDQLDEIQQAAERSLAVSNLDRDCTELRLARAALSRIRDGSFGTCQECEGEIHPKRLAAMPWAVLCLRCQEVADRNPQDAREEYGGDLLAA
jgi:DnaK suppressor protein